MEWDREKGEKNRYMVIGRMDGRYPYNVINVLNIFMYMNLMQGMYF